MINAIICDIDGTIALNNSGRPWFGEGFEKRVVEDDVNPMVNKVLNALYGDGTVDAVLFVSGRMQVAQDATLRWLSVRAGWTFSRNSDYMNLFMRKDGDFRPDTEVKREIYDEFIAPRFNVLLALDDRPEIVDLWRSMDIPTWQVAEYR